jgi:hypothetical protein
VALNKEQFQELRSKGLSVEQIVKFERGEKPVQAAPVDRVEKRIAGQEDMLGSLGKDIAEKPLETFLSGYKNPLNQPALRALGGVAQRTEATIANPILELQKGNFLGMPSAVKQGVTGERLGQFGDVIRRSEVGGPLNEPIAAIGGLLGSLAIPDIAMGGKMAKTTGKAGSILAKTPGKVKRGLGEVFHSGKNLRMAEGAQEAITQSIESLKDAKLPAMEALIESSADDALLYKNKLRPVSKQNSAIYGNALDKIESQVTITQSKLKSILDDTVNEALDAGISAESNVLKKIKELGEKYGAKTESYFDDLRGSQTRTLDEKLSVNDLKTIKNQIFKIADEAKEGADDVANAIFMKKYGNEIASQSSDFAKLQAEYAPYLEAKKWAYRTFKPFTKDEIPNGNRVLKAIAQGKGKLEDFEYLKRLEQGSGRFQGTGELRKQSQSMADSLQKISDDINQLRRKAVKNKEDIERLRRLVGVRNWITVGALTALGAGGVAKASEKLSTVVK